jgi:hypothetical protein
MASDTDNEDEPEDSEQTTPRHQQKEDVIFDTCSDDGSVNKFTNGNTAAGYTAVTECNGVRSIKMFNMAPHPTGHPNRLYSDTTQKPHAPQT